MIVWNVGCLNHGREEGDEGEENTKNAFRYQAYFQGLGVYMHTSILVYTNHHIFCRRGTPGRDRLSLV